MVAPKLNLFFGDYPQVCSPPSPAPLPLLPHKKAETGPMFQRHESSKIRRREGDGRGRPLVLLLCTRLSGIRTPADRGRSFYADGWFIVGPVGRIPDCT